MRGLPMIPMLGLITAILTGTVIILFCLAIEAFNWQARLLLTAIGRLISGVIFSVTSRQHARVGVLHVNKSVDRIYSIVTRQDIEDNYRMRNT